MSAMQENLTTPITQPTKLNDVWYSSEEEFFRPVMQSRLGVGIPEPARFLGASFNGADWAMFAVANYVGYDCEVFFATIGRRTPIMSLTRKMAEYVFDTMGCRRVTSRVDKINRVAMRHNKAFGMKHEGTLRQASPEGNDVAIFGMLREEYRYG